MPTVLMRDVLWRASILLQDVTPQFYRSTEHDMVDAVNDAQVAIAKFVPGACSRVDAIKLRPGTLQTIESIAAASCKPGDGSTPTVPIIGNSLLDPICNMGVDGLTPGRIIRMTDGKTLDAQDMNWHAATPATVIKAVVYDPLNPRYFHVYPPVHGSTLVWMRLAYTAQPLKIPNTGTAGAPLYAYVGSSTQTITIADEYLADLVNYVVAVMCMKPSEWADAAKGSAFAGMFTGSLNAKVLAITGSNPNLQFLQFAPTPAGRAK